MCGMLQCLLSLVMVTVSDVFALINYFSQTLWFSVGACIAGLLYLRYTKPDMPRPIKVNLAIPVVFLICVFFLVVVPSINQPFNTCEYLKMYQQIVYFFFSCVLSLYFTTCQYMRMSLLPFVKFCKLQIQLFYSLFSILIFKDKK